jgi:DNA-binding MarR family transcriptional regulator
MEEGRAPGTITLLTRLSRVVYRRTTNVDLGMHLKNLHVLTYLRDHEHAPQQGICEYLHVDANYVVIMLNELEAAGYVERRRDPQDRRRHIVDITPAGREASQRAEAGLEALEDQVLGALSPEERTTLHDLLSRALDGASHPMDGKTTEIRSHD